MQDAQIKPYISVSKKVKDTYHDCHNYNRRNKHPQDCFDSIHHHFVLLNGSWCKK